MNKTISLPSGPRIKSLKGSPRDFGRLGKISLLEQMPWSQIPTYYYDFNRFDLPLTDEEATREFGRNIPIFGNQGDAPAGSRQTNAAIGSGVNEPFVAMGAGVVAMGEGEGFAINGASVVTPSGEVPAPAILPNVFLSLNGLLTDCYCGAVDLSFQPETTRMATLWWGAPTWRFIEKFFQAYRLQVIINARFQIVDESLFDVGMTPVPPEFVGASDSLYPTMPFINAVNTVMVEKNIGQQFIPANFTVEPSIDPPVSVCLPPPLAAVTYGHPRIIGLGNRIYCFNQPLVFIPGMRFEVSFFNVEDISVYTALRNSITVNCTSFGPRFTDDVAVPVIETLMENCAVNCTIPGGSVSLGVVFKGFALWPRACVDYLANYLPPDSLHASMYTESSYLNGLLTNPEFDRPLRDKVAGNLGLKPPS